MKNKEKIIVVAWSILILLLLFFYVSIFYYLDQGLQTIFDEGFFYMQFKPSSSFTVSTRSLSLSSEIIQTVFPNIDNWDVLTLRRLAFGVKGFGIIILLFSSCLYIYKEWKEKNITNYFILVASILLFGLLVMPSVVLNMNDALLFFEMSTLSFCLLAASSSKNVIKSVFVGITGFLSFMAFLCSVPGGAMLGLLCFVFLIFYKGFNKIKMFKNLLLMLSGVFVGVLVMHFFIIRLPDVVGFFNTAIAQTTNGTSASHHSLTKLSIQLLLDIRDLVMTLTMLFGITYLCKLVQRVFGKCLLSFLVGLLLFVVLYKYQIKPAIGLSGIITWIVLMSIVVYIRKYREKFDVNRIFLLIFLYLLPFGISLGSNIGILNKAMTFMVPWGILLCLIYNMTNTLSRFFSNVLLIFVFVFVLFGHIVGIVNKESSKYIFDKEYPISRMELNGNQYAFYNEVYNVLEDYGYESNKDTVLGFCFNEMTIVSINAVSYTNDQLPEEFVLHDKDKLVRPRFMILTEWDESVLMPFFETLGWDVQNNYDVIRLQNNPDPNSGWEMSQSTLYCLKSRE